MTLRWWVPLLMTLLVGCGTSTRAVRLDTGRGEFIVYVPLRDVEPVELDDEEFAEAVQTLGRNVPVSTRPREAAFVLLGDSLQLRAWSHVRASLGVVSVEEPLRGRLLVPEEMDAPTELASAYGRWCKRKGSPGDCLHLLDEDPTLDEAARRTLAFQIALDSVWQETAAALEGMADKDAIVAMLATTGAVYLGLWLLPEPVSKGVAAVLTVGLIAYLGWDTVWSLIQGFRMLAAQVEVATTFEALHDAGERYGAVMGKNAARVFIMLATAALGSTAQMMAARIPTLPGSSQAALVGVGQGGFQLAAAGQVSAVAISSGGIVTIALDSGAVAVTAWGTRDAPSEPVDSEGHEHHIASNKFSKSTRNGGPWTPRYQDLFDRAGMSLNDPANKVRVKGHKGPHPRDYHEEVYRRLDDATAECSSMAQCREALTQALHKLAREISSENTWIHKLVTRGE